MNDLKGKHNKLRNDVATRMFKMENKSKMYLGILKHWLTLFIISNLLMLNY